MRMSETLTDDSTMRHHCGFPVRVHIEMLGVEVDQTRTNLPKMQVRCADVRITYQRLNDPEYLLSCPRCNEALPKAVTP
jgi:hypothetical protein